MKKTTYKRISGLFILVFAFFVIGITSVNAQTCSECAAINGNLKNRYPITITKKNATSYILKFGKLDSALVKAKPQLKLIRVESYDSEKVDSNGKAAETDKTVFQINGGVLTTTSSYEINLAGSGFLESLQRNDTINFVFEPANGYVDPAYTKCRGADKPCGENGNITYVESSLTLENFGDPIAGGVGGTQPIEGGGEYTTINCGNSVKQYDDFGTKVNHFLSVAIAELNAIYSDHNVFNYKFCYAKIRAIDSGKVENFTPSDTSKDYLTYADKHSKPLEFKCDYNVFTPNDINSANYYEESKNTKYLYGKSEYKKDFGTYTYSYPTKTEKEAVSCKLKCEESVVVEYGPPIASSAGLCFGYKVRVTSRVNCGAASMPNAPTGQYKYCIPAPSCKKEGGNTHDQGGPNDEFDACIQNCDGGKYTSSCSNKCYQSVYGKSLAKMSNSQPAQLEKLTALVKTANGDKCTPGYKYAVRNNTRDSENKYYVQIPGWDIDVAFECTGNNTKDCISYFDAGYYVMNGQIYWDLGAATGDNLNEDGKTSRYKCSNGQAVYGGSGPAYWYGLNESNYRSMFPFEATWYLKNASKWGFDHKYNYYTATGIPTTGKCKETCTWGGCPSDSYFSEETAQREKEKNEALYEKAIKECSAAASCSTTTSTYAINVTYKTVGSSTETTIYFPYTTKEGKPVANTSNSIKYEENNKAATCVTSPSPKNSVVIDQDGQCYACKGKCSTDCDKLWYRTEWTFPGVWFDRKHRSGIRYDEPSDSEGDFYDYVDKKFCLPQRLSSTNSSWYYLYQSRIIKLDQYKGLSINQGVDSCEYNYIKNSEKNFDASKLKYNISAETKKFGMFEWDITMKCFYATPSAEICKDPPEGNNKSTANYKIRTVDLKNVFPDEDGKNTVENLTTIRNFNWSKYANQITKDPDYASQPLKYKNWIEANNYKIYDGDTYLDYEIYLTKDSIADIKKKNIDYSSWDGSVVNKEENRSHSAYRSALLRDKFKCSNNAGATNKCPGTSVLKCNNIRNYEAEACEEF